MHPDRILAELTLGHVLQSQSRSDEAAAMFSAALRKQIQLFGSNSGAVADTLDSLAIVRYSQGQLSEAKALSHDAISNAGIAYGDRHPTTASMRITLSRTLAALGEHPEAELGLRKALDVFAETVPADHQYIASAEYFLGEILLSMQRLSEAEAVLAASTNRWERSGAPPWRAARSASALGEALYRQGRAEKYLSESFHQLAADSTADTPAKEKARERFERYVRKPSQRLSTSVSKDIAAQ
jgi:tetratricopeptide (TPR) repeat protein